MTTQPQPSLLMHKNCVYTYTLTSRYDVLLCFAWININLQSEQLIICNTPYCSYWCRLPLWVCVCVCVFRLHIRALCQAVMPLHKRSLFNKLSALSLCLPPTLICHSLHKHLTLPVHLCFIVFSCACPFISFLKHWTTVLCELSKCSLAVLLSDSWFFSVIFHSLTCFLNKDDDISSTHAASSLQFPFSNIMFVFLSRMLYYPLSLQIFLMTVIQ